MKLFASIAFLILFVLPCRIEASTAEKDVQTNKAFIGKDVRIFARSSVIRSYPGNEKRYIHDEDTMKIVDSVLANCDSSPGVEPCLIVENYFKVKYYLPVAYIKRAPSAIISDENVQPQKLEDPKNVKQYIGKPVWSVSRSIYARNATQSQSSYLPVGNRYIVVGVNYYDNDGTGIRSPGVALENEEGDILHIVYRLFNEYAFSFSPPPPPPSSTSPAKVKSVNYSKSWGKRIIDLVKDGKVIPGMTQEQAKAAWGEPEEINATVNRFGTHEQWVYGNGHYLYFDNDVLDSIQTSR